MDERTKFSGQVRTAFGSWSREPSSISLARDVESVLGFYDFYGFSVSTIRFFRFLVTREPSAPLLAVTLLID